MYEGLMNIMEATCKVERDSAIMVSMFEDAALNDQLLYSQDEDIESEDLLNLIDRIPETDDESELEQLMDDETSFESVDSVMMISESTEDELFTEGISGLMKEIEKSKKEIDDAEKHSSLLDKYADKANKTIKELLYGNEKVNDILVALEKDLVDLNLEATVVVNKLNDIGESRIAAQVDRIAKSYKDKTMTALRKISSITFTKWKDDIDDL